jgi:hypothetical protein
LPGKRGLFKQNPKGLNLKGLMIPAEFEVAFRKPVFLYMRLLETSDNKQFPARRK